MPNWKKVLVSGSDASLNSLYVTNAVTASIFSGSFTGSLFGTASYATSASNALTASFADNGGVTQILAGPNITISPLSGKGQVTISSTGTGSGNFNTATGSYGSFYDTTTQTNPVANAANSMSFNEIAITNGVLLSGSTSPFNTYIKTENAGVYNIQFSAQIDKTDGGEDNIDIWIRKNGIDLTDTATTITLPKNNNKVVAAWNWFVQSATNDYYQIIWSSADVDMRLLAEVSSSVHPGIPSVILTANRIDQFLSNTGSFNGDFNGSFTGSLFGTSSFAVQAATASYVLNAVSSSFATSASFASNATSASQAANSNTAISSSYAATSSYADNFTVTGTLTAQTLVVQTITSSVIYSSGSNIFGNDLSNTQKFTGSVQITGSLAVNGSNAILTNQTSSMSVLSSSFALSSSQATNANSAISSSYALTASFALNIPQTASFAISASQAQNAVSSSFATTASFALNAGGGGFPYTGSAIITGSLDVTGSIASTTTVAANVFMNPQTINSDINIPAGYNALVFGPVDISGSINVGSGSNLTFLEDLSNLATTGSNTFTGNQVISGSLNVTSGITGSLFGTASFVTTSSFAVTASYTEFAVSASNAPGFTTYMSQSVAAATWSFVHNLDTRNPIVQVYNTNYAQIIPNEIISIDAATTEIRFTYAQAGFAVASNGGGLYITGSTARLLQSTPSVTWSFNHNLGTKYPGFEVYDSGDNVIIPAGIKALDNYNAEIYFSIPATGIAIANYSGISGSLENTVSASYAVTASYADTFTVKDDLFVGSSLTDYATVTSSISGENNLFTKATGSYASGFFKYVVMKGAARRAGEIIAVWNTTGTASFTDFTSTDIGDTSAVTASVEIAGSNIEFNIQTNNSGWTLRSVGTFM
jgi:hypothetical protein